ncbi:MAG: FIMAH domain-containing protein [Gemmatimonadaceae bacterium]
MAAEHHALFVVRCGLALTLDAPTVAVEIVSAVATLQSAGVVNGGQANALTRKIDHALNLFHGGKYADAIAVVQGFVQQVTDLTNIDHVLTASQAETLLLQAQLLIQLIQAASEA